METFEEWYSNRFGEVSDYNSQHTSREAWNHQQEKIERLEAENKLLEKCRAFYGDKNNWLGSQCCVGNRWEFANETAKKIKELNNGR